MSSRTMQSENKTPKKLRFIFPGQHGTTITWEPSPRDFIGLAEQVAGNDSGGLHLSCRMFHKLGNPDRLNGTKTKEMFKMNGFDYCSPCDDYGNDDKDTATIKYWKEQLGLDAPKDWSIVTWAELKEAGADKRPPTKFCKWNTRHDEQECDDSAMKACQIDDEREEACSYKVTPRFIKWCLQNYCCDGVVKFLEKRIKKPNGVIRTADYLQSWIRFDKTYYSNQLYCQHHLSHNLEIDTNLLIKD